MKKLSLSISSFCKTGSGTTPSRSKYDRYFGGGIPWVKSGELRESIISNSEETITEEALAETALKIAPKGAILVAMYGANVGRVGILDIDATTNQAICHIVPEKDKADSRYIFHALQQKLPEFISRSVGGAQPNISQQIIRDTKIFLPPIDQQKRIAAILDKAEELRSLRRQSIEQLDILSRSIFIEMFGDPIKNEKGWEFITMNECAEKIQIGPFGTQLHEEDYIENGIPLINPTHIRDGRIFPNKSFSISIQKHEELKQYHLKKHDVILGRRGEMGRCAIVSEVEEGWLCGTGSLFIRFKATLLNSAYLFSVLSHQSIKRYLEEASQGVTMANLNKTIVSQIPIQTPPLSLQQEFAQRIEAIEHLKSQHRESLVQLDKLFASLQHRAFRGEL
jgi:type I restriction enzyme, S subunit